MKDPDWYDDRYGRFPMGDTVFIHNTYKQTDSGFKNIKGLVLGVAQGLTTFLSTDKDGVNCAIQKNIPVYDISSCGLGLTPESSIVDGARIVLTEKTNRRFWNFRPH